MFAVDEEKVQKGTHVIYELWNSKLRNETKRCVVNGMERIFW